MVVVLRCELVFEGGAGEDDGEDDGDDDEDNNHNTQAPPLELAGVAGVLDSHGNLFVSLFHVLNGVLGICLSGHNHAVLLLNNGSQLLIQKRKLGQGLLNALELVVAGSNIAQDRVRMPCSICLELLVCQ